MVLCIAYMVSWWTSSSGVLGQPNLSGRRQALSPAFNCHLLRYYYHATPHTPRALLHSAFAHARSCHHCARYTAPLTLRALPAARRPARARGATAHTSARNTTQQRTTHHTSQHRLLLRAWREGKGRRKKGEKKNRRTTNRRTTEQGETGTGGRHFAYLLSPPLSSLSLSLSSPLLSSLCSHHPSALTSHSPLSLTPAPAHLTTCC